MRILCMVSSGKGHLDLGGSGFKSLIQLLLDRGHSVQLLSTQAQCDSLPFPDVDKEVFSEINKLMLPVEETELYQVGVNLFAVLKAIELQVRKCSPDIVLVDRILGLCDPLLSHLEIPWVSIGTNGSIWVKENGFNLTPKLSLHNRNGFATKLTEILGWKTTTLSAWSSSPYFNVSFLDASFHPLSTKKSAYVNLFTQRNFPKSPSNNIGISLGNGSYVGSKFHDKINAVLSIIPIDSTVTVFGDEELSNKLKKDFAVKGINIVYAGFVDFNLHFDKLSHLIFAGGIGTLWYCIEYNVIPIILSGDTHDQHYNSLTIKDKLDLNISELFTQQEACTQKLVDYKRDLAFSHTLHEAADEIEGIV